MELPNNAKPEFIMNFEKFAKSKKGLMFSDEKVFIKGTFRGRKTKEVVSGDDFLANRVWESGKKLDAKFVYKIYLEWFNYTLKEGEEEREFVDAELRISDGVRT